MNLRQANQSESRIQKVAYWLVVTQAKLKFVSSALLVNFTEISVGTLHNRNFCTPHYRNFCEVDEYVKQTKRTVIITFAQILIGFTLI